MTRYVNTTSDELARQLRLGEHRFSIQDLRDLYGLHRVTANARAV
jgi:hypothetical protein